MRHKTGQARAHFSHDGKTVVMNSVAGDVRAWDVATGRPYPPPKSHGRVANVVLSKDGDKLAICARDRALVCHTQTGLPVFPPLEFKTHVDDVRFSRDSRFIFTVEWPGFARQWDAETGDPVQILSTYHAGVTDSLTHFAVHPTRTLVASQSNWGAESSRGSVRYLGL